MDLLSQRYANPCFFMDGMIQTGRFNEFVDNLIQAHNDELEEKTMWDVWLHKIWEGGFDEFKESVKSDMKNQNMSARTIEATVQDSLDILKNFSPEGGEN